MGNRIAEQMLKRLIEGLQLTRKLVPVAGKRFFQHKPYRRIIVQYPNFFHTQYFHCSGINIVKSVLPGSLSHSI